MKMWVCKSDCEIAGGSREKFDKTRDFAPNTGPRHARPKRIVPQTHEAVAWVESAKNAVYVLLIVGAYLLGSWVAS